ncbi:uncharacterized protein CLUP02_12029 [Colletotrichum lupini]|uniref:Uncharacterized protein n=1 Tax=Colletotrichum lupini TaxID=145971 RepID=A0A9Q8WKV4_9PEZI|nr:uncharacterized protein CLUP02_12029 [Colletotrichum lupini]UQC86527.1 hypothetical protein CLUP02_12029 [Colletotrichum lupini]
MGLQVQTSGRNDSYKSPSDSMDNDLPLGSIYAHTGAADRVHGADVAITFGPILKAEP